MFGAILRALGDDQVTGWADEEVAVYFIFDADRKVAEG